MLDCVYAALDWRLGWRHFSGRTITTPKNPSHTLQARREDKWGWEQVGVIGNLSLDLQVRGLHAQLACDQRVSYVYLGTGGNEGPPWPGILLRTGYATGAP